MEPHQLSAQELLETYGSAIMEAAKVEARLNGRELLTPAATSVLFGVSDAAVRTARLKGHVNAIAVLSPTVKETCLIPLTSALAYWSRDRKGKAYLEDFDDALDRMRLCGLTVWDGIRFYHVLHPWALFEHQ